MSKLAKNWIIFPKEEDKEKYSFKLPYFLNSMAYYSASSAWYYSFKEKKWFRTGANSLFLSSFFGTSVINLPAPLTFKFAKEFSRGLQEKLDTKQAGQIVMTPLGSYDLVRKVWLNRGLVYKGFNNPYIKNLYNFFSYFKHDRNIRKRWPKLMSSWGMTNTMVQQALSALYKPFKKGLSISGIGYRAFVNEKKNLLILKLGYSHLCYVSVPKDLKVLCLRRNRIVILGSEKDLVNSFAKEVRSLRSPDAYKGKGIRFFKEKIKLRPGKKASSK